MLAVISFEEKLSKTGDGPRCKSFKKKYFKTRYEKGYYTFYFVSLYLKKITLFVEN